MRDAPTAELPEYGRAGVAGDGGGGADHHMSAELQDMSGGEVQGRVVCTGAPQMWAGPGTLFLNGIPDCNTIFYLFIERRRLLSLRDISHLFLGGPKHDGVPPLSVY